MMLVLVNDKIFFFIFAAVNVSVQEQTGVLHTVNDNIKDLVGFMVSAADKKGDYIVLFFWISSFLG